MDSSFTGKRETVLRYLMKKRAAIGSNARAVNEWLDEKSYEQEQAGLEIEEIVLILFIKDDFLQDLDCAIEFPHNLQDDCEVVFDQYVVFVLVLIG